MSKLMRLCPPPVQEVSFMAHIWRMTPEVRDLFEEVADPAHDPKERLRTILMLTSEHFTKAETGVFPNRAFGRL